MRLRQPQTTALLLLLPAVHVFAAKILTEADEAQVARPPAAKVSGTTTTLDASTASSSPSPAAAAAAGGKGTKDAPVDGFDGKPHEGPYIEEKPVASKKGPGGIEELRPDSRISPSQEMTKEEWAALKEEDDSVMNDPNRASPKGNTGIEGGVSAKEKERLAQEGRTGEKLEKVPEAPKEARPLPHGEQQHLKKEKEKEKEKAKTDADTETRVLGAQGLEVSRDTN